MGVGPVKVLRGTVMRSANLQVSVFIQSWQNIWGREERTPG